MSVEPIEQLKADAKAAGVPIAFVVARAVGSPRVIFEDGYIAGTVTVARNHIKIEQAQRGV